MGIVRELSPELDPVEFPDYMGPEQVEAYVAEKGDELRRRLIARKQASMATETEGEEALKYAMGEMSAWEQGGSMLRSLPQETTRFAGGLLEGLGAYLAETPIPRERGEVGTGVVQENLRRQQRTRQQVAEEIEQSPLRAVGREVKEAAPEIFPTLPGVRDSLPSQVMGGLGSIVGLAPAMVAGPAAPFVGGAMYGLSAGEDLADDARRVVNDRIAEALANGDYDTAADLERRKFDMEDKARQAGRVIGAATEGVLGVAAKLRVGKSSIGGIGERMAERLVAKSAPQMVQRAVRGAVEGGATEAAQEATEQALGNAAALAVYDPDRSIMDDLGQAALVGGLTGGIAGGARGSDLRNPLPRSTAAAAGKRVAQIIPQDVGDIAAPDITEADVEDVFAGVPQAAVEETVAVEEPAPVETPTAAAPVETPPQLTPESDQPIKAQDSALFSKWNASVESAMDPMADGLYLQEASAVDPVASNRFTAHGMRGFEENVLDEIIAKGLKKGDEGPVAGGTISGLNTKTRAPLILLSKPDQSIRSGGIGAVVVNRPWAAELIPALQAKHPGVLFIGPDGVQGYLNQPSQKPKRTRKPKPNAIEAAIPATPAPKPATPPQAEAPRVTVPPDDAASATRAVEADIPLGVKRPAVVDPKLESLSDAEFTKVRRATDANLESLEKRYDAEDPTLSRSELAAAQDAFTAVELERFRRSKKGLYAPDLFYDLVKLADRARDPNSEAAAQARILIEEIQRQGMSLDQLVSELSASSPDEAEVLRGQAEDLKSVLGQQKPTGIENRAIDVESRQVDGQPEPVAGAPEEGIAERVAADLAMEQATARTPQTPAAPITAPEAGIAERVAADTEMERATAQAGQTPVDAALNVAPEEGVVAKPQPQQKPKYSSRKGNNKAVFRADVEGGAIEVTIATGRDPEGGNEVSSDLTVELLDDQPAPRKGTGVATELYVQALEYAKREKARWVSDTIRSGNVDRIYERLIAAGVPFKKDKDGMYVLEPSQFKGLNLKKVRAALKAKYDPAKPITPAPTAEPAPKKFRDSVAATIDGNGNPTRGGDYYSGLFKQASDADLEDLRVALSEDDRLKPASRRLGDVLAAEMRSRKPVETTPLPAPTKPAKGRKTANLQGTVKEPDSGQAVSETESSKGKHLVRVVQSDGSVDLHIFDSEDSAGLFHGQLKSLGGAKKIGRAKGNSKTPLSVFVSQSKSIGKVNVIRHDKPITPAPAAEPAPAQAAEVSTPEVVKQTKPPMAPKAQKAFLLEKIDEAIAAATEDINPDRADSKASDTAQAIENADTLRRNKSRFGTVTIEVPGDGTFEVLNTKPALKAFKEKAKKFPTGKTGPSDASLPSKNQSKPVSVGSNTKDNFLSTAEDFVSQDEDDGKRAVLRNIISNGFQSAATDGRMLLVWNESLGGSLKDQALFDTNGKPVKTREDWQIPNWEIYVPKDASTVFTKLNTERLFGVVQQAIGVQPRKTVDPKTKASIQHDPYVDIVKNPDGSIGVYAVGADQGEYTHNTQKGGKVISTVNADRLLTIIQASRKMGSKTIDIDKVTENDRLEPLVIKWPGALSVLMPVRRDDVPAGLKPILAGKPQPDIIQRALDAAIKATDPKSATFSDPFLIAAVGLPVLNAALRLARRVYLRTRNLVRAKQQGMRLIRRRQRTIPAADMPRVEEAFSNLVDNGITEGPPPQTVTPASPLPGGPRRASRGLFKGDVTIDSDAQWQAQADEWIAQFNGNLRRAFEAARSTDFQTTGLNQSAQYYVFGKLLELSEIAANAARNDVDMLRHLNLQKEIAEAMKFDAAEAGKTLAAAALVQDRLKWMFPVLTYRNLIREAQKRLPFPDVVADEVRTWLSESGRRAVQEMRNAMTDADKVFARELKSTVRDMRVVWRDVMTASVESQENMRRKILEELVKAPELKGLSRQGYIDIANLLGKAWEKERARIFQAEFRKQVPLPSVKEDDRRKLFTAIPNILKWANLGLLDNEAFRNAIAPQYGVAKFDGETAKKLNTMAQEAQKVGGSNRNRLIMDMYNVMQQEGGVRAADVFRDYWYGAVLSGIRTQVDNAMNILTGALTSAMGITMAKSEARGAIAKAYGKGLAEAVHDFWPILWRGELWRNVNFNPNQPANTLEAISKSGNVFAKALGQFKYVGRLMSALDHINALSSEQAMMAWALSRRLPIEHLHRYMTPSETVLRQARARAQAEGTTPDLMDKRVREIVQESIPVEILISARDLRQLVTFTNQPKGVMGGLYRGIQEMEKAAPGFKMLSGTQFIRFAGNYTNEILNYVAPVALYRYYMSAPSRQGGRGGLKMGEEERQLILAKLALGSALGVMAGALFLGDDDEEKDRDIDITGSFKSLDPNKRRQVMSEGRQPYSIRFGNTYVSYRQLPFGGVLGAIGELRDRQLFNKEEWNKESLARKVADAGMAGAFIVRDSSAISGLTEFLGFANAYKYDMNDNIERTMPKYMAKLAGSVIPNIAKEIDAWSDPSIYKADTGHEYFLQQMPYMRRELGAGPVLNVLGEPVQVERYPWSRWIKTRREDKAWTTLGTLASRGVFLPVPSANVKVLENGKRRPMTPQEQHAYQKRVGADYRKFVEENSQRLLQMKPDEAVKFIDKQTERIRRRND